MGKGQVADKVLREAGVARGQEGHGEGIKMKPKRSSPIVTASSPCSCFLFQLSISSSVKQE